MIDSFLHATPYIAGVAAFLLIMNYLDEKGIL